MFLALFLAPGGASAEPQLTLGRDEAPLTGPWKFRLGDDPGWAAPGFDDAAWETVDLTSAPGAHDPDVGLTGYVVGWMERGHPGAYGFAWYRMRVEWTVAPGDELVLLGPTYVEDAYELYWNGTRIGGCGDFGERPPKAYATRPTLMRLPLRSTSGESVIAIRVYLSPAMRRNGDAGGVHIAPILAKQHAGEFRYAAQWAQTLRGYAVDAVEPALLILLIAALALFAARVAPPGQFGLALGAALALTAALRANQAVYFWAEVEGLRAFLIVKGFILEPLGLLAWTAAWNRWSRPSRASIDIAAVALTVVTAGAALAGDSFALARGTARVGFVGLFLVIAVRIARRGTDRPLALSAMALVAIGQFAEELWMLKVPGIWFPFGVGVSRTQYAYALLIPLLAVLLARRALQAAARAPPSRARLSKSLAEAGE